MNNEGFIPRARARGHARTLRARALYGMAGWGQHVVAPGYPLIDPRPLGLRPRGLYSPCTGAVSPCTAVAQPRRGWAPHTLAQPVRAVTPLAGEPR